MIGYRKKVCVVGLGYIGLPTAALIANRGYFVHGVDIDCEIVDAINKAQKTIEEPGLDTFLKSAIQSKRLVASTVPDYADIFIIAVPTPLKEDHSPELSYVFAATESIAPYIDENSLVILESTSPVGTTGKIHKILLKARPDLDHIHVAYCPERVLPGQTMKELIENDRSVGGITHETSVLVKEFYSTFVQGDIHIIQSKVAELVKLVENAYRDINIAFANELSMICDKFDINVWEVISYANKHPRVNVLNPGSGVGGHCIAIDPWFIVAEARENAKLIKTARKRNDDKPIWVVEKVVREADVFKKSHGSAPVVACMGIAYKPDIDDLRESPSLQITKNLISRSLEVLVVEPNVTSVPGMNITGLDSGIKQADIIVFLVGHKEFRKIDIDEDKIVFDICGILH